MTPAAAVPVDEAVRLARLHQLLVLDTQPEPLFDTLTQLAAELCEVPISLISLIDTDRQWFKSCLGLPGVKETPRDVAFCAHAIVNSTIFEVPDAALDPRFAINPLVIGEPSIRFYAGAPLTLPGGERLGTLCVIDRQPRKLTLAQRAQLTGLAQAVTQALLMREQAVQSAWSAQTRWADDFRVLAESSPLGVFRTDAQGACQYTNASWQTIYGLTLEQSLGAGWSSTLHPEDSAAVFEGWQTDAAAGRLFDMSFRVRRPDGTVRSVRSRARQLLGPGAELQGYVGVVEDVTDRQRFEAEIQAGRQQLQRLDEEARAHLAAWHNERDLRQALQRLAEERREMLDVLAHEVRQPLNNASAALQSAGARVAAVGDIRTRDRLERAQSVINQVVSQLDNTLATAVLLSGVEPLAVHDTDVDTLVKVCIADLSAEQRPRVHVVRETAARTAAMDMALLRLAVRNLLVNALRFAPPGSAVTLRLSDSDNPLALVLDVENNGPAIPPELRAHLFERGRRGQDSPGQGLGLYIARRALELHNGQATCVRSDGVLTVMRLLLVQSDAQASDKADRQPV